MAYSFSSDSNGSCDHGDGITSYRKTDGSLRTGSLLPATQMTHLLASHLAGPERSTEESPICSQTAGAPVHGGERAPRFAHNVEEEGC